jgi:two-component sensor histidine kinase
MLAIFWRSLTMQLSSLELLLAECSDGLLCLNMALVHTRERSSIGKEAIMMHRSADALSKANEVYEGWHDITDAYETEISRAARAPDLRLSLDRGAVFLLREMTHRINNEFASLISLLSRAANDLTDVKAKATFEDMIEHVHGHAQVHQALAMPEHDELIDAADYLGSLCQAISRSKLARRGIKLTLVADRQYATASQCWKLGMIVSELVNNAARHAFVEGGGEIRVDLVGLDHQLRCRVADDGKHCPQYRPSLRRSGLKIVEALAAAMAGTIDQRLTAQGASTLIRFPAVQKCRDLPAAD